MKTKNLQISGALGGSGAGAGAAAASALGGSSCLGAALGAGFLTRLAFPRFSISYKLH